ncbi:MAG: hypothetical protein K5696_00310 [Lachnospiraceae bacterium]|nr:hypothetical protein [Lachnospiraceae bacterium]
MRRRIPGIFLLLAQILILFLLFIPALRFSPREIPLDFDRWGSEELRDGDGYTFHDTGKGTLESPEIHLPAGSYTLHMDYVTEKDQSLTFGTVKEKQIRYLNSGEVRLSRFSYSVDYDFDASLPVDGMIIKMRYGGEGTFSVYAVSLTTNRQRDYRRIVIWFFLCLVFDLWFFLIRRRPYEERRTMRLLAAMTFLASLPLFMRGIYAGDDLLFHTMRIDALAQELRRGIFPVRMESLWFHGYSYPPAIMYGDFLLYPFAVLRLCGFPLVTTFKAYMLFINIGTAVIGYLSFRRIFRNRDRSLLLTFIYLTASYRLVNLYTREAAGEYSAQMFLPMVAAGMWGIYTAGAEKDRSKAVSRTDVWLLGAGMAGIIATHNLSAEMTVLTLLVSAILLIRISVRPAVLLGIFRSILLCVLLCAFYTVPFLDYYLHADFMIKQTYWQELLLGIQANSAKIVELFSFFHTPLGYKVGNFHNRMMLTPGLILMATLVTGLVLVLRKKANGKIRFLLALSLIMLFLSSDVFPWDLFAAKTSLGRLLATVQFAWRYIGCSLIPLTLLTGLLLEEADRVTEQEGQMTWGGFILTPAKLETCLAVTAVLMTLFFVSSFIVHADLVNYRDNPEVDNIEAAVDAEYMLSGSSEESIYPLYRTENIDNFAPVTRDGYRFTVYAESAAGGYVDFPVFAYPYFAARDEQGNALPVIAGDENRMVRVLLPAGFAGQVHVDFQSPWYWTAAWWLSVCCGVVLLVFFLLHQTKGCGKIAKLRLPDRRESSEA